MNAGDADAIVLLAHLMERDGSLSDETRRRADRAVEVLKTTKSAPLLLMGWNYRSDTELCVSDAIANYLRSARGVVDARMMIDRMSRDTVGDAVFSKAMLRKQSEGRSVLVVTSEYHLARALKIFRFVYGPEWDVGGVGAEVAFSDEVREHELASLGAFERTFDGITRGDDEAIWSTLAARHPFYNGKFHPKLGREVLVP